MLGHFSPRRRHVFGFTRHLRCQGPEFLLVLMPRRRFGEIGPFSGCSILTYTSTFHMLNNLTDF